MQMRILLWRRHRGRASTAGLLGDGSREGLSPTDPAGDTVMHVPPPLPGPRPASHPAHGSFGLVRTAADGPAAVTGPADRAGCARGRPSRAAELASIGWEGGSGPRAGSARGMFWPWGRGRGAVTGPCVCSRACGRESARGAALRADRTGALKRGGWGRGGGGDRLRRGLRLSGTWSAILRCSRARPRRRSAEKTFLRIPRRSDSEWR